MIKEKRIKVVLETLEPFRIGGKEDPLSETDNPVARLGNRIVIPGSSLKGAFRTEVEQYLINIYFKGKWSEEKKYLQPCIPATKLSSDEETLVKGGKYRGLGCVYPDKDRDESNPICPVCYLFGAQGLSGFLRVPFLYADTPTSELYSARVDRARKVGVKGTNRPYELLSAGIKFEGTLYILLQDNILDWKFGNPRPLKDKSLGDMWLVKENFSEEKLINDFVIERLKSINILGGYKSKGFGKVKITATVE